MEPRKKLEQIAKLYLINIFGYINLYFPILVLFLQDNGLSLTKIMLLQSIFTATVFILEVPSGVFADLFGLKRTLIISEVLGIVGVVIYGFADTFYLFAVAEILVAACVAFLSGAESAFLYDTLKEQGAEKQFKRMTGRMSTIATTTMGVSAIVSGFLATALGYRPLFFLSAGFFTIGLIFIFFLREPRAHKRADRNYIAHLKEGIRFSVTHKQVRKYMIYRAFCTSLLFMVFYFMQPYYAEGGMPLVIIGLCVASYFLFSAAGSYFAERITSFFKDDDSLLLKILLLGGFAYVLLYFVNIWIGLALISLLVMMGAIKQVLVDSNINEHTESSHRATVLSVSGMGHRLVYALLGPLFGYICDVWSIKTAFLMIGVILILFWGAMTVLFRGTNDVSSKS